MRGIVLKLTIGALLLTGAGCSQSPKKLTKDFASVCEGFKKKVESHFNQYVYLYDLSWVDKTTNYGLAGKMAGEVLREYSTGEDYFCFFRRPYISQPKPENSEFIKRRNVFDIAFRRVSKTYPITDCLETNICVQQENYNYILLFVRINRDDGNKNFIWKAPIDKLKIDKNFH